MSSAVTRRRLSGSKQGLMKTYEMLRRRKRGMLCCADRQDSKVLTRWPGSIMVVAQAGVGTIDNAATCYPIVYTHYCCF